VPGLAAVTYRALNPIADLGVVMPVRRNPRAQLQAHERHARAALAKSTQVLVLDARLPPPGDTAAAFGLHQSDRLRCAQCSNQTAKRLGEGRGRWDRKLGSGKTISSSERVGSRRPLIS